MENLCTTTTAPGCAGAPATRRTIPSIMHRTKMRESADRGSVRAPSRATSSEGGERTYWGMGTSGRTLDQTVRDVVHAPCARAPLQLSAGVTRPAGPGSSGHDGESTSFGLLLGGGHRRLRGFGLRRPPGGRVLGVEASDDVVTARADGGLLLDGQHHPGQGPALRRDDARQPDLRLRHDDRHVVGHEPSQRPRRRFRECGARPSDERQSRPVRRCGGKHGQQRHVALRPGRQRLAEHQRGHHRSAAAAPLRARNGVDRQRANRDARREGRRLPREGTLGCSGAWAAAPSTRGRT